ncbi:MAG: CHASE3 domain-containing protein [Pyrinomonadaceae bacterium]
MAKFRTVLKWRFVRALQIWNRLPIRAQGGITVFIPILAVLISFCFAIYGNRSRAARQDDIQRKFTAVRQYGDLLTLMIDAETGNRGFLLTSRAEYLEPYQKAVAEIPNTIAQLKGTIETEPGEKPRAERLDGLAKVQELINRQLAFLRDLQNSASRDQSRDELNERLRGGKSSMDEIRAGIATMQNKEEILLTERVEEINSIRNRDYILIFVTLLIGVLVRVVSFYLFDRGIVRRVSRLTEYVDGVIRGEADNFVRSKKSDAVGMLEEKIVELAREIEGKRESKK